MWPWEAMEQSRKQIIGPLRDPEEPHECRQLIETHKADPPGCFGLALTRNHDSPDTILSHFSKSVFILERLFGQRDETIHLCYFSQASKIT